MSNRRKITTAVLRSHNFKQIVNDKNIWIKHVPCHYSHDKLIYTYYWKERILKYTCYDCIGFVQYSGQMYDEYVAYREIITI